MAYYWLRVEDVAPTGDHPVAAGGFADIWEVMHDGHKVALKSYRCYETLDFAEVAKVCNSDQLRREGHHISKIDGRFAAVREGTRGYPINSRTFMVRDSL
jgi:hypothetical protein